MTETEPASNLISSAAVFIVTDIHRSVKFYQQQLGFEVSEIWGAPPSFAIADTPRASIMLKQGIDAAHPAQPTPNARQITGIWDAYIWVRNLQSLQADLDSRKTPYSGPTEQPHGCTEIVVTDPDGYLICFGFCP